MKIRKFSAAALVAIATVVLSGACSKSGSGEPTLSISQPAAGTAVSLPFTVQFASSEPLGDESTGLHHVHQIHRWAGYFVTPVLIGHIVIASGILPGYRGVARAMHWGGRVRIEVARRIWPGWTRDHS